MAIPDHPLEGRIGRHSFSLTRVTHFAENHAIALHSRDDDIVVFLGPFGQDLSLGAIFEILEPSEQWGLFSVTMHYPEDNNTLMKSFLSGYVMRLEIEPEKDGLMPARIYLCVPDRDSSYLAGTFVIPVTGTHAQ